MAKSSTYDADSISVLEGLEAVRKRPGMYIGSVSTKGLNHLIYEIVDNSVDEHLAGFCSQIEVYLEKDGSCTVADNGRGIPVGMHGKGMSAERLVFTTLHAFFWNYGTAAHDYQCRIFLSGAGRVCGDRTGAKVPHIDCLRLYADGSYSVCICWTHSGSRGAEEPAGV